MHLLNAKFPIQLLRQLDVLAEAFAQSASTCTRSDGRGKGQFLHAAASAFDAAMERHGNRRAMPAPLLSDYSEARPSVMALSLDDVIEDIGDHEVYERAEPPLPAKCGVGMGYRARCDILALVAAKGLPVPLTIRGWLSDDSFTDAERIDIRARWLASERADLPQLQAQSQWVTARPYAAIAGGAIVGFFDDEDAAVCASSDAIADIVGPIGVAFIHSAHDAAATGECWLGVRRPRQRMPVSMLQLSPC